MRIHTLLLVVAIAVSACGGDKAPTGTVDGGTSGDGSVSGSTGAPSSFARDPSPGGNFLDVGNFPFNYIASGCGGADCIPSLTDPTLVGAGDSAAGYVRDSDLVMGIAINGEALAIPHNIGWWHEIVNVRVGGQAICATLCPLTGTGMVFNGDLADGRLTLGVSGLLFNNNLIMYDRRDQTTLYPQMTGRGIQGPRTGQDLELLPVTETTWKYWKRLYPDTKVVGGNTGLFNIGQYTTYPYRSQGDYRFENSYIMFPLSSSTGTAALLGAKEMAMGVRIGELVKAYPFRSAGNQSVINDRIGDTRLVAVFHLDAGFAVPYSREVADGAGGTRTLTFDKVESTTSLYPFMMKDRETSTTWNLKGQGIAGSLKGTKLTQLPSHNGFWFAWGTFWDNMGIY